MEYLTRITCVMLLSVTVLKKANGHEFSACRKEDSSFDSCLSKAIENGVKLLKDGLPKYNLGPLDPLATATLTIGAGQGVVHLVQNYQDVTTSGLTTITVHNSTMDFEKRTLIFSAVCPLITVNATYDVEGKILVLPVKGKAMTISDDLLISNIIQFGEVVKDDAIYFEPQTYSVKLFPKHVRYFYDNLFDGNKLLGDNINNVLNQEWLAVFEDVRNGWELAYADIFLEYAKIIFSHIPINALFLL